MSTFDTYVHTIVERGEQEAQRDGSATIEAHHLLLAIAAQPGSTAHRVLTSTGLDHQAIRDALHREFEHSLSTAGVSLAAFDLPQPTGERPGKMGASAKLALERGLTSAARKKDLRSTHLLLGILHAPFGTVPRGLALANVDREDLLVRVQQTLTSEDE